MAKSINTGFNVQVSGIRLQMRKVSRLILVLVFCIFCFIAYSQNTSYSFIPQNGPDGSQANIKTYYDSIQNPDTKQIISVNYQKNKGGSLASILCVVTKPGTVYNHTNLITDRFAKSTITEINNIDVNGNLFTVSQLSSQDGSLAYYIDFNIYKSGNNYYINNNWYQTKQDIIGNNEVMNVQLSAPSKDALSKLTENLITTLSNSGSVLFTNDSPVYPKVFVKNGFYKNGFFYLTLDNKVKANTFYVKGSYHNSLSGVNEKLQYLIVLDSSNINQIAVPIDNFTDLEFTISNGTTTGEDFVYYTLNPQSSANSTAGTQSINASGISLDNSKEISLLENYPNPVNITTNISFELSKPAKINLSVYDIAGNQIKTIADGNYPEGKSTIAYNVSDLSNGIYFCRLTSANNTLTKKLIKY